jgi:hypothetical protein
MLEHNTCCNKCWTLFLNQIFIVNKKNYLITFSKCILWSFSTNMRFVLYSFLWFYVTLETNSNVLIIFDWSEFLHGSLNCNPSILNWQLKFFLDHIVHKVGLFGPVRFTRHRKFWYFWVIKWKLFFHEIEVYAY